MVAGILLFVHVPRWLIPWWFNAGLNLCLTCVFLWALLYACARAGWSIPRDVPLLTSGASFQVRNRQNPASGCMAALYSSPWGVTLHYGVFKVNSLFWRAGQRAVVGGVELIASVRRFAHTFFFAPKKRHIDCIHLDSTLVPRERDQFGQSFFILVCFIPTWM